MGPRRKLGRKKPSRSSNLSDPSTRLSTSTTGSATPRLSRGSNPVDGESTRSDSEEKSTKTTTARTPTSYEFQAPQFHDFMRATPAGGTVDEWFDARQGTPEDAGDESFRDSANFSDCDDSFTAKRITMIYTGNRNGDHGLFPETEVPEPEKEAEPEEIKDRNFERLLVNEDEGLEHLEPATSRSSLQSTGLRDVSEKRSSFGAAFQERPKSQDRRSYTRTSFVRPMATRATATLSSFISSSTLPASTSSTDAKRKTKKTTLEKKSEVTTVQPTQRSVKLTVPQEFHFATDQLHPMSRRSQVALGTLGMLKKRSTGGITKKGYKKKHPLDLTVPKPFRFQSSARSIVAAKAALGLADESDSAKSPYVPLALKLRSFQDKTPERFKVRPMSKAIDRLREQTRKLTQPKSPQLLTKSRLKPSTLLPTEERLAQETAITAKLFKAKPINPKIFESQGDLGVPKIPKSELTVPMSPAITKGRNSRFVATESPPTPPRIRANPIPHNLNQPFRPVIEHRKVVPEPFHLPGESLHASRQREKEYLLEKLREQEDKSRMFKARPLPSFDEAPLRSRGIEPKEPVIPKPFNFQTDKRGEQYQERLRAQQDLEERRRNKENQFHAQPLPKDGPFIPKRSTKPLTTAEDVILHSDLRAEGRRHFDEERKEREKLEEELRELRKLESEHQEKEEIRILRERLVHHANPVRHFASVQVVPSNKGLTLPQSPAIGKKRNMTEPTHAIRTRRRKSASYDRKNDDVLLRNLGDASDTQHPDVALDAYFRQNDNYSHEREAGHIEEDGMDKYFLGDDQGDVVA